MSDRADGIGPGKYDDIATLAREIAGAQGVLLVIFGGDKGDGFSAQASGAIMAQVPKILRGTADQIQASMMLMGEETDDQSALGEGAVLPHDAAADGAADRQEAPDGG